jgi:hypothetical protein
LIDPTARASILLAERIVLVCTAANTFAGPFLSLGLHRLRVDWRTFYISDRVCESLIVDAMLPGINTLRRTSSSARRRACLKKTTIGVRQRRSALPKAIEIANIPVLLMMLVQLTGNLRWLDDNYRTRRARGMNDNDTGGHPEAIVAEIRAAALEAIVAWRAGRPVAIPEPSRELRLKMLSVAMGEEILDEYDSIIAEELSSVQDRAAEKLPVPDGFGVVIIGAGVSGLCAAVNLQRAGVTFTILEKSGTVGGIWRDNRYPGAGVDTPNHLYSFANAPYDWSMYYALRDELHTYLE